LVGQHGANYGVSKTEMMFPVEEETADIFFTWGQRNSLCSNTFAGFNWKIPLGSKSVSATPKIIILTRPPWPSKEHFSITPWYREYVDNVVALVQAIDEKYRGSVVIRMHPSGAPELEKKVWSQFLPDINLDDSNQFEIGKIGDGGVLVFTYLSTLFYEVLCSQPSLNIVGSWNYIRDDVRDQHVETFNELHAAGILFESSSDAANHVSGLMRGTVQHPTAVREKAISRFNATLNKRGSQSSAAGELLRNIRCALTSTGFETR
jgi:putative transferase (TIGR04331 family)